MKSRVAILHLTGPISRGMQSRLVELAALLQGLPQAQRIEAKRHLDQLFDDAQRVCHLESHRTVLPALPTEKAHGNITPLVMQ